MIRTALCTIFMLAALCSGLVAQEAATGTTEQATVESAVDRNAAPPPGPVVVAPGTNGDQAWMLMCCALVLLMTPGLAFFYGGLVGRKNILSVLMQCFLCVCVVSILWVVVGFSLAFSGTEIGGGFAGDPMTHFMLKDISFTDVWQPVATYNTQISEQTFMAFQMMFAIITPALIVGAFAERMKFAAFMVFLPLWSLIVYCPVAHWVWYGPEGMFGLGSFNKDAVSVGALDFAGGTVVHINAGIAALVCCLVVGPRRGFPAQMTAPHNLPFAVLGAGLLWFGWFGFNGGSGLYAGDQAVRAFVTTHMAAATAGVTWAILDLLRSGKPTVLGMITGVVAGLVAITPAAGFVDVGSSLAIGAGATVVSYIFVAFVKPAFKYDDSLDVFGVHGMAGIWGALATGIFAIKGYGFEMKGGLIEGNSYQVFLQAKAVLFTLVYSGLVSFVLLKIIDYTIGLRISEDGEKMGLDLSDHAETAYTNY
ncbi:MAG: ammonium transporter [Pirellula sp.]